MKVTFIQNNNSRLLKKIRIFFKDNSMNPIQIDLRIGEIVYAETNIMTNSLIIYKKKGIIKIEEVEKPKGLNYYIGYTESQINEIILNQNNDKLLKAEKQINLFTKEQKKEKTSVLPVMYRWKLDKTTNNSKIETNLPKEIFDSSETIDTTKTNEEAVTSKDNKTINKTKKVNTKTTVKSNSKTKKKKKKKVGRPKKRGPKKGSHKKKTIKK